MEEQLVELHLLIAHMNRLSLENAAERSRYRAQFQMDRFAKSGTHFSLRFPTEPLDLGGHSYTCS